MANDYYNKALKLINPKLAITQMKEQGYQAYVYPQPTIDYACKVLNARELKLYLQISGQANNFNGAMKFYSVKANIKSNHYSEILESLEKKGFIKHIKYESIEVLFPRDEAESQKGNQADSQIAISPNKESSTQKGIEEEQKGNNDSQSYVYNRETNINKEFDRENQAPKKEEEFEEKANAILEQIGNRFNIKAQVFQQAMDLKAKGFSNEFIFYALDNKRIEDFSKGIGLLFLPNYQNEIKAKIQDKKIEDKKMEERLEYLQELLKADPNIFDRTRKVRVQKSESDPIKKLVKTYDISDFVWEEEEEEKKNPFADLI